MVPYDIIKRHHDAYASSVYFDQLLRFEQKTRFVKTCSGIEYYDFDEKLS